MELSLNLSLESINHVDLSGLVVSSCHVKEVFINAFPSYQCHDAFDGEGSSVDKVSIKEVLIVLGGVLIEFEDVNQVIKLSVDVSANCELFFVFDGVVDKRGVFEADVFAFFDELESVSFV